MYHSSPRVCITHPAGVPCRLLHISNIENENSIVIGCLDGNDAIKFNLNIEITALCVFKVLTPDTGCIEYWIPLLILTSLAFEYIQIILVKVFATLLNLFSKLTICCIRHIILTKENPNEN